MAETTYFSKKIPKLYIERVRGKDGKIILTEFPKGLAGRKMFKKLLKAKRRKDYGFLE